MMKDPLFKESLKVTAKYVLILVPGVYIIGLSLALLVKQKLPLVPIPPLE